jgi:predicted membrane protein
MGVSSASIGFTAYVVPFLISTVAGSIIAGAIIFALKKNGTLNSMLHKLS